jgi:hypothetical protein
VAEQAADQNIKTREFWTFILLTVVVAHKLPDMTGVEGWN